MNKPTRTTPSAQRSHVGPKETGGMAGAVRTPANANLGIDKPKVFDHEGAIGKQFTENGAIGGIGQSIGGPLAKDGFVGRQFTTQGIIGGVVQGVLGGHKVTHS
ncbi:hypothetical protein QBC34DRAFT_407960 [Podospora aff. communis PSN243]|uniref:Glycine zipper 2TM domain-containing protein n=1 Tax=Podospora aff. communis PSN243 TaxID=3040156 RepID=A0AAV9GMX7_9PEZI|nr:hypothetical protein QBC34DRAFT_407960 [Podospora aff. communis PSN243]